MEPKTRVTELTDAHGRLMYPAWRYKANGASTIVENPTADAALGKGWFSHPNCEPQDATSKPEPKAAAPAAEPKAEPKAEQHKTTAEPKLTAAAK